MVRWNIFLQSGQFSYGFQNSKYILNVSGDMYISPDPAVI
jgi:hypothetical protein